MTRRTTLIAGGAALIATGLVGGGVAFAVVGEDDTPITGTALEQASEAALAHTGQGTVTDSEVDDEDGRYEVEVTLDDGREVDVHLDDTFAVLGSEQEDDDDADDEAEEVSGEVRDQAGAAALEAAGGGTVTDVETSDEQAGGYEVDVQQDDGTEVEVLLDAELAVVSVQED